MRNQLGRSFGAGGGRFSGKISRVEGVYREEISVFVVPTGWPGSGVAYITGIVFDRVADGGVRGTSSSSKVCHGNWNIIFTITVRFFMTSLAALLLVKRKWSDSFMVLFEFNKVITYVH